MAPCRTSPCRVRSRDRARDAPPVRRRRCCRWTSPRPTSSRRPGSAGSTSSRRGRADRDWLEEHFDFHPLDYEDVYSRNQRPKLDQYDDYVFIVLHFPLFEKDDRAGS